jgi:hypothetical protein
VAGFLGRWALTARCEISTWRTYLHSQSINRERRTRDRKDDYLVALLDSSLTYCRGDKDLTDIHDARIVSPRTASSFSKVAGQRAEH